jgi:hypothetical protein
MVTTYPPLHRMSVIIIAGTFHFSLDYARPLRKESCHVSAFPKNLNFNKKQITFPQNQGRG